MMKRKRLTLEIQELDRQLTAKLAPFQQTSNESIQALRQISPLWLVCTGFIAGIVSGSLGWKGAYTLSTVGLHLQPIIQAGLNQLMGRNNE